MPTSARILYCRCAYAKVVPLETKDEVLRKLSDSGVAFDAVPDLCERSARRDPALKKLASECESGGVKIAACYPRAVKWLLAAAGAKLPEQGVDICNMRTDTPESIVERLLGNEPAAAETK